MSTEIKDADFGFGPHALSQCGDGLVHFRATAPDGEFVQAGMSRADFLDAIRTELNVLVIDKTELPEVVVDGRHLKLPGTSWPIHLAHKNLAAIKSDALDGLALAAYLEANPPKPPVDEYRVLELTRVVMAAKQAKGLTPDPDDTSGCVRELLLSGRIEVVTPKDIS